MVCTARPHFTHHTTAAYTVLLSAKPREANGAVDRWTGQAAVARVVLLQCQSRWVASAAVVVFKLQGAIRPHRRMRSQLSRFGSTEGHIGATERHGGAT